MVERMLTTCACRRWNMDQMWEGFIDIKTYLFFLFGLSAVRVFLIPQARTTFSTFSFFRRTSPTAALPTCT